MGRPEPDEPLHQLGPARADQSGEAEDLALPQFERRVGGPARHRQIPHGQHGRRGGILFRAKRIEVRHVAADHQARHLFRRDAVGRARRDALAIPEHGDLVGDGRDLRKAVGNIQHRHALRLQVENDGDQRLGLDRREGGRRLVEDHDPMGHLQRPGDLHELSLGDRQPRYHRRRGDVGAEIVDRLGRERIHAPVIEHEPPAQLAAHENILRDRQMRGEQYLLMHQHDAVMLGIHRAVERHRLSIHRDGPLGRREMAGEDLHQRRLAGTVLADHGMHGAGRERQVDAAQDLDRAEGL